MAHTLFPLLVRAQVHNILVCSLPSIPSTTCVCQSGRLFTKCANEFLWVCAVCSMCILQEHMCCLTSLHMPAACVLELGSQQWKVERVGWVSVSSNKYFIALHWKVCNAQTHSANISGNSGGKVKKKWGRATQKEGERERGGREKKSETEKIDLREEEKEANCEHTRTFASLCSWDPVFDILTRLLVVTFKWLGNLMCAWRA